MDRQDQRDSVNLGASGQMFDSPTKIGSAPQQASDNGSNFTRVQEYAPPSSFYSNECQTKLLDFGKRFKSSVGTEANTRDTNVATNLEESGSDDDHGRMESLGSQQDVKDKKSAKAPLDAQGCSQIMPLEEYISEVKGKYKNIQDAYAGISKKCSRGGVAGSDNKKILHVGSHLKQEGQANLVREMSIEILTSSEGCVPIVKSFESDAFSNQSFVKDIKFYNKSDMKFKQHFVVDKGFLDISYKTKDISTLHFKNYVFFYKRDNDMFKLMQYDCVTHEHKELPTYEIREPSSEYRYHIMFSKQFGNQKDMDNIENVHDFLAKQYVFAQVYMVEQKDRTSKRYVHQQLFAWKMQYMAQAQYGNIAAPGGQAKILSDPIQYICHIKEGGKVTFVAIDPFCTHEFFIEDASAESHSDVVTYPCNNEYQVQNADRVSDPEIDYNDRENRGRDEKEMKTECKHRDFFPFLKMPNPEFIIQKMSMNTQQQAFDQYYYLTTDHQIHLVYPNHINIQQKANYMTHIAKNLKNEKTNMIKYTASNFPYQQDFEERIEEIVNEKTKKVSIVSASEGQSKNVFKQVDELKTSLGMNKDARFLYEDTVIQSQDQERTTMMIYNTFPNPEDPMLDIEVEVYQFENRVAYPSKKVRDQIKLVQYIKNKQDIEYGVVKNDKRLQADVSMFYMNAKYKNVVSSPSNIQTVSVYQQELAKKSSADQFLNHQLAKGDHLKYIIVEGKNGNYHNIKIKQDQMKGKIHFQSYFKNKFFYTFVFTLIDDSQKLSRKHNYFFVKKSTKEVENMAQDNVVAIVTPNTQVTTVVYDDRMSTMSQKEIDEFIAYESAQSRNSNKKGLNIFQYYTKKMTYEDLLDYQRYDQSYHVCLTFESLIDNKHDLFYIPMIFQEKSKIQSHNLMIFDVFKQEFVKKMNINPNLASRKHLRKNETGFVEYSLTRTADIYETDLTIFEKYDITEEMGKIQHTKYQIGSQFMNKDQEKKSLASESTLILNEYFIKYSPKSSSIKPIGIKSVLLSKACSKSRAQTFDKIMILPFITKERFNGSQIVIQEEGLKNEHAEPEKFRGLYLLDQEQNNIYHMKSDLAQFGYQKFYLSPDNLDEFILVVASQLSQQVYLKGNLEANETHYILSKLQQKMMSMKLENPEVQTDLNQMLHSQFYQPLEILQGKSLNEIALCFPQDVANGLRIKEEVYSELPGSLISELCKGDKELYNFYKMMDLCEENMIIQTDFTFSTSLRLGMEMNQNESIKLILNHIFKLNRKAYNDLIQLDLPMMLKYPKIERIFPFLGRSHKEYMDILDDQQKTHLKVVPRQEFCNLEDYLNHPELPPFQRERIQYHIKESYTDFHTAEEETVREVIAKDPHMTWGLHGAKGTGEKIIKDKNVEAEHSIIDFQQMIIGEKIRGFTDDEDGFKNIEFTNEHLADIICIQDHSGQNIKYYNQETVRKIIDFQFLEVKSFLQVMFWIYIVGFQIPFLLSLSLKGKDSETFFLICYMSCLITQIIMILQEFAQLKEQGLEYFKDYYNLIDSSQFVLFLLTFLIRVSSTNDDATILILFEGILMFQSFNKVFYFIRIYEDFNFILIMASEIAYEVLPFATFTFGIMVGIAKIYEMLELDVNQSDQFGQYHSQFVKILFQTYQSAKGDKIPPTLSQDIQQRLTGDKVTENTLFITIMVVWAFEQIYYFIMITFYTAQVFQSFERIFTHMQTYQYMTKARFNEESYQVISLFRKQKTYKAILLSIDKTLKKEKEDEWQGISASLSSLMKRQKNDSHDKEVAAKKVRQQMHQTEAECNASLQDVHDENVRIQRGLGAVFNQLKTIGAR